MQGCNCHNLYDASSFFQDNSYSFQCLCDGLLHHCHCLFWAQLASVSLNDDVDSSFLSVLEATYQSRYLVSSDCRTIRPFWDNLTKLNSYRLASLRSSLIVGSGRFQLKPFLSIFCGPAKYKNFALDVDADVLKRPLT